MNKLHKMDTQIKVDAIIGIDPGASGGIAVWRSGMNVRTLKIPKNLIDLRQFLEYMQQIARPIVFLEKINVRPDDVMVGADGANLGKLYRIQKMIAQFEQLKAAISFSGIPFVLVHPMTWQSTLKLRRQGETKADRKARYKDVAGQLYPGVAATLWNADAVLIMHFGRYVLQNDLKWVKHNLPEGLHEKLF